MNAMMWLVALILIGARLTSAAGAAEEPSVWTAESGSDEVALLELYTSEGCSSCPPAETWLGARREDPGLWRAFVPVAWHVTYWDRLGWTDRWADRAHTARQEAYASAWEARSIYTPAFVRAGEEWRIRDGVTKGRRVASPGRLRAVLEAGGRLRVTFEPTTTARAWTAHVALLGGGIVSDVRAGENRGRELRHEFVALETAMVELKPSEADRWSGTVELPAWPKEKLARRALAVWVSRAGEVAPVQAAGGWFDVSR